MSSIIYLIGFMASGKSKIGKKLADHLGYRFVDLDQEIEEKEKRSIQEIFEQVGEEAFRKIESEVLKETPTKEHTVIALGGGTPCSESNIAFIRSYGTSIYLKLDPEILIGRLRQIKESRPLTKSKSDLEIKTMVYDLLDHRSFYYEQADLILEDNHPTVNKLLSLLGDQSK